MTTDVHAFRSKPWSERVAIFTALSSAEKAALVRALISGWLAEHRETLSDSQVAILEENIAFVTPELYERERDETLDAKLKDLERRTAGLLSRQQMREALTMHW